MQKEKTMEWIAISGSWRWCTAEVEEDVRNDVRALMQSGDGIVSGGALGVDFVATDEALKHNPKADRIKILLPTTLERYAAHYRMRADEGVIAHEQAEALIAQLTDLKARNALALIENSRSAFLNNDTYNERSAQVVQAADQLFAYHVNGSAGVQYAIDCARDQGIPTEIRTYVAKNEK